MPIIAGFLPENKYRSCGAFEVKAIKANRSPRASGEGQIQDTFPRWGGENEIALAGAKGRSPARLSLSRAAGAALDIKAHYNGSESIVDTLFMPLYGRINTWEFEQLVV